MCEQVQQFNSVLLNNVFIDDDQPDKGALPNNWYIFFCNFWSTRGLLLVKRNNNGAYCAATIRSSNTVTKTFFSTQKCSKHICFRRGYCGAVVCMIMTTPSNWTTKARAVLNTWAKRCHIPLFFYSRSAAKRGDPIINATHTVALDVPEGRDHLTGKTMAALRYSLATYGHVADWFLKCDDDTLDFFWFWNVVLFGRNRNMNCNWILRLTITIFKAPYAHPILLRNI